MRAFNKAAASIVLAALIISAGFALSLEGQEKKQEYVFWPMIRYPLIAYSGKINGIGATAGDRYYFTTSAGMVYAVDLGRLTRDWAAEAKTRDPSTSTPASPAVVLWQFKSAEPILQAPLPVGDLVVVIDAMGGVTALDAAGKPVWTATTGETADGELVALGEKVLIHRRAGHFSALDGKTGKDLGTVTVGGELVEYACAFDGMLYAALKSGDLVVVGPDGKETERIKSEVAYKGPFDVTQERILAGKAGGVIELYDRASKKPVWSRRLGIAFRKVSFLGPKRIGLMGVNEVLFCLSSRTGDLRWWRGGKLQGIPMPMFWQGRIAGSYATTEIFGLVDRTGDPRWRFNLGTLIVGDLHPWRENMVVHLYAASADQGYLQLQGPIKP